MKMPDSYTQLQVDLKNRPENIPAWWNFFPQSELDKLNRDYETEKNAPGAVIIGNDGGDEAIVLDIREDSPTKNSFFFMPFIPMGWEDAKPAGKTLEEIGAAYKKLFLQ